MTTGTKVFLAVFALIVAILVVYYGWVVPARSPTVAAAGAGGASDTPNTTRDGAGDQSGSDRPPGDLSSPARSNDAGAARAEAPPPRQPAPTIVEPAAPPTNASAAGGLLSEGVSEANGEDPLANNQPNAFLPLMGLNAGDAQPTPENPAGNAIAPTTPVGPQLPAPSPSTRPSSASAAPSVRPQSPLTTSGHRPQPRIEYIIKANDTYTSIAAEWLGDGSRWSLIAKENPTVDPARLKVGQRIYLPSKDAANKPVATEPVPAEGELIYTVQSGDTLTSIAREHFNDPAKWQDIYNRNRQTIGDQPGALKVGMKLRLKMSRQPTR